MKIRNVCQDCCDRVLGCHSTCEKYKEAKAELEAMKDYVRRHELGDWDYTRFRLEGLEKNIKARKDVK